MKVIEFSTYQNPDAWICDDDTMIQFKSIGDACLAAELFRDLQEKLDFEHNHPQGIASLLNTAYIERDKLRAEKMQVVTDLSTFKARLKETQIVYAKTCGRLETERDDSKIEIRNLRAENDKLRDEVYALNLQISRIIRDGP